jgi:hypothetical protein
MVFATKQMMQHFENGGGITELILADAMVRVSDGYNLWAGETHHSDYVKTPECSQLDSADRHSVSEISAEFSIVSERRVEAPKLRNTGARPGNLEIETAKLAETGNTPPEGDAP